MSELSIGSTEAATYREGVPDYLAIHELVIDIPADDTS